MVKFNGCSLINEGIVNSLELLVVIFHCSGFRFSEKLKDELAEGKRTSRCYFPILVGDACRMYIDDGLKETFLYVVMTFGSCLMLLYSPMMGLLALSGFG